MRILVLWRRFPRPDFNAGDRRLVAILEHLARAHRVDYVVPFQLTAEDDVAGRKALSRAGVNVLGVGWSSFATALARTHYHIALFEFYQSFESDGAVVRSRQPGTVLVIDSVDVHFAREAAGAKLGVGLELAAQATRTRELAAYRAADAVIAASDDDADILRREGGMPPVFVIPIVVPIRSRPDEPRGHEVLFVGGFVHQPNLDGVRWFVSEIWPRVHQAVPSAIFNIVGSNPPAELASFAGVPGVRVLGYVPETAPFLDRASVSVAPLRYGAGMKGKVNEALASGVPVVSTSVGAQGIPVISGNHAILADRPDDFADAVVSLLCDPVRARAMGVAGQELARKYSPESVGTLLDVMLRELVPRPDAVGPRLRWLGRTVTVGLRTLFRRWTGPRSQTMFNSTL